jgi:hypothetical protein
MIDGTNLGGPSITIPQPELSARFGSTLINAGTTRDFALRPDFGCVSGAASALREQRAPAGQPGDTQAVEVQGRMR